MHVVCFSFKEETGFPQRFHRQTVGRSKSLFFLTVSAICDRLGGGGLESSDSSLSSSFFARDEEDFDCSGGFFDQGKTENESGDFRRRFQGFLSHKLLISPLFIGPRPSELPPPLCRTIESVFLTAGRAAQKGGKLGRASRRLSRGHLICHYI